MKTAKMNKQGKIILASLIVVITMSLVVEVAFAETGHGAPSGKHYTLNILGKAWDDKAPIEDCGQGHRIFVNIGQALTNKQGKPTGKSSSESITKIYLFPSPEPDLFAVLDCDGTDGRAEFMLPDPNGGEPNATAYSVYVRALGKPNGKAEMKTCATDPNDDEICSVESVSLERKKGKQKFVNVSKELLTICANICVEVDEATGECTYEWRRVYLFDPLLQDYLWKYDNKGLKHAQLRFYPQVTRYPDDVPGKTWDCPPPPD